MAFLDDACHGSRRPARAPASSLVVHFLPTCTTRNKTTFSYIYISTMGSDQASERMKCCISMSVSQVRRRLAIPLCLYGIPQLGGERTRIPYLVYLSTRLRFPDSSPVDESSRFLDVPRKPFRCFLAILSAGSMKTVPLLDIQGTVRSTKACKGTYRVCSGLTVFPQRATFGRFWGFGPLHVTLSAGGALGAPRRGKPW